jgi:hypothetical protein
MSLSPPTTLETDRPAPAEATATADAPFVAPAGSVRSIPLRTSDLTDLLATEADLAPAERARLREFARMLHAVFNHEYHAWLLQLKDLYAPLDPDSDCLTLGPTTSVPIAKRIEAFLGPFEDALVRANYVPLDLPTLEQAIATPNGMGLDYIPDLKLFERIRVYVRGRCRVTRVVRGLGTWFRKRTVTFDAYRRLVIAIKFRPSPALDEYVRSDVLYLRMFKDVPFVEMDMHLPEHGTKIKMRWIDKLQIASPVVTGIPTLAAKLLLAATISRLLLLGIMVAPITAGLRSFFGYKTAQRRYLLEMVRHLYYLTLANNASVLTRLIDSCEEEEFKETLIAYYILWRGAGDPEPWDEARLDQAVEQFLSQRCQTTMDFDIGDALGKLVRLGLAQRTGQGHLLATSIDRVLEILDQQWDHYFNYARAPQDEPVHSCRLVQQKLEKRDCEPGQVRSE